MSHKFAPGDTICFRLASTGQIVEANFRGYHEGKVVVVYCGSNWVLDPSVIIRLEHCRVEIDQRQNKVEK